MTILEFIFGILALAVILIIAITWIGVAYANEEVEKENEKLKEKIKKLQLKFSSEEYKKVKEVNNDK